MIAKTKFRTLIHNLGLSYTNSFLAFIILMILAKMLGADAYSMVAIGVAAGGFIIPLVDLGSAKTFVRDAVQLKQKTSVEDIVANSYSSRLTVLLMVVVVLFAGCYFIVEDKVSAITIAMLSLWVGLMGLYPTSWFDYKHKTFYQNLCVFIERLVGLSFIVSLFYIEIENYEALILSIVLVSTRVLFIVVQIKLWMFITNNNNVKFRLKIPALKSPGINLIFSLSLISNAMLTYGNQLVFSWTGDPVELSSYSLAFQMVGLVFLFQSQALRLINRVISEVCIEAEFRRTFRKFLMHTAFLVLFSAFLASVIYFASLYLPVFLDDERFNKINEFIPILCIWIVIVGAGQVVTQYLLEFKQELFYLYVCVCSGFISLMLGIYYIPDNSAEYIAYILLFTHGGAIVVSALRLLSLNAFLPRRVS